MDKVSEAKVQLSELPRLTSAGVSAPLLEASKITVTEALQEAFGAVRSSTSTVVTQDDELPLGSVAVNVTEFGPRLAQVSVVDNPPLIVKEGELQLSILPSLMLVGNTIALPNASN